MNQTDKIALGVLGIIGLGLVVANSANSKNNPKYSPSIDGISSTNVKFQPIQFNYRYEETSVKKSISNRLNRIITNCKNFKIGKSGIPYQRASNYKGFKKMIVLCESRNSHFISELEKYYLLKLRSNRKNRNINGGSAGTMKSHNGKYYLYVVVN